MNINKKLNKTKKQNIKKIKIFRILLIVFLLLIFVLLSGNTLYNYYQLNKKQNISTSSSTSTNNKLDFGNVKSIKSDDYIKKMNILLKNF
jgi:hypothetical protein